MATGYYNYNEIDSHGTDNSWMNRSHAAMGYADQVRHFVDSDERENPMLQHPYGYGTGGYVLAAEREHVTRAPVVSIMMTNYRSNGNSVPEKAKKFIRDHGADRRHTQPGMIYDPPVENFREKYAVENFREKYVVENFREKIPTEVTHLIPKAPGMINKEYEKPEGNKLESKPFAKANSFPSVPQQQQQQPHFTVPPNRHTEVSSYSETIDSSQAKKKYGKLKNQAVPIDPTTGTISSDELIKKYNGAKVPW